MRFGYLNGIFGCFGVLRRALGVMNGRCTNLSGGWGGTDQTDLAGDRLQVTVSLLTSE